MSKENLLSTSTIKLNSKIIIYGFGKRGRIIYNTLFKNKSYELVGIVDKYKKDEKDIPVPIFNIEWLVNNKDKYDYIIIAIENKKNAYSIMLELNNIGIDKNIMLWQDCRFEDNANYKNSEIDKYLKINTLLNKNVILKKHNEKNNYKDVIWFCWFQGIENSPDIVKSCYEQLKKLSNGHKICIITRENINNYISLPDYILDKHKSGIISNTHLSDIIRIMLLAKYGGLWVDATCYFTEPIPKYYFKYPFFCYQSDIFFYKGFRIASSWLLACEADNVLILTLEQYILNWWKVNSEIVDYYLIQYLLEIAIYSNMECFKIWNQLPYFNNVCALMLQYDMHKKFDYERYKYICSLSPVHKMTYKFNEYEQGTVLDYILNK